MVRIKESFAIQQIKGVFVGIENGNFLASRSKVNQRSYQGKHIPRQDGFVVVLVASDCIDHGTARRSDVKEQEDTSLKVDNNRTEAKDDTEGRLVD